MKPGESFQEERKTLAIDKATGRDESGAAATWAYPFVYRFV
jgi:hypothetical protein